MITVALSASIGSPIERVWRAFVDPTERAHWDDRILGEVELASNSGRSSSHRRSSPTSPSRRVSTPARPHLPSRPVSRGEPRDGQPAAAQQPIKTTSWRFRLGGVPLVMRDRLLEADRHGRLVSRISIGSMQFDQTLTLYREDDETGPRTRLGMKLVARNSIAVIGEVVPRLDVQKIVIEYVDATLRQVQKYCEADA